MRSMLAALAAVAMFTPAALARTVSSGTFKTADGGTIAIQCVEIEGIGTDRIVLRDSARTKLFDKAGALVFDAQADKIIVTFFTNAGKNTEKANAMIVKSAELVGSPKIVYTSKDATTGVVMTTTATSRAATFDGTEQAAYLTGDVKIVNENPALFEGPAVMTGDEAMVNLKSPLGPDDVRFRIRSNPPGLSKIQASPKPREGADKKK